jgi:hypothetical protein
MATGTHVLNEEWTVAGLLACFGPISHRQIRQEPPPGQSTEQDVLEIHGREKRLCERVDGVMRRRSAGFRSRSWPESSWACCVRL